MSEEEYINKLCTEHYWNDIKYAFGEDADTLTKQVYYNGDYYQCIMDGNFCLGVKYIFSES